VRGKTNDPLLDLAVAHQELVDAMKADYTKQLDGNLFRKIIPMKK
jgi:hypothetical protein